DFGNTTADFIGAKHYVIMAEQPIISGIGIMLIAMCAFKVANPVQFFPVLLPFSQDSFDMVVSGRFLHLFSPKDVEELLGEMIRILKPGLPT
ncbi:MAG: class I SAM-dependent methyltransferase, partial [Proteobacteria bacterium]|nr:class I SAM-dependent methyltransferase [Pseudomonadota bacterium]